MDLSNIKERRLPVLEQTAQRYALMAYEVMSKKLAVGFKSISYSFEGDTRDGSGKFRALFKPFDDDYRSVGERQWMSVSFSVAAVPEEDWWVFTNGEVTMAVGNAKIFFICDGGLVLSDPLSRTYHVGNGENAEVLELVSHLNTSDFLIF